MALLEARRLVIGRDAPLSGPFDLNVESGARVVVMGRNGSGKSTLLLHLALLLPPHSGEVRLAGMTMAHGSTPHLARIRSFASQRLPVSSLLTGREFLGLASFPHSQDGRVRERISFLEERFLLSDLMDRPLSMMSGGEARRLAVARALAQADRLVFLDEPDAFLDPWMASHLYDVLREFSETFGHALVVVTHSVTLAARWAHTAVLVATDRTPVVGPAREVLVNHGRDVLGVEVRTVAGVEGEDVVVA